MGTSQSSPGAPSGVPLVPPWVPDIVPPDDQDSSEPEQPDDEPNEPDASLQPEPIAPTGRFAPSRTSFGRYARSGSSDDMRRGLGHYIRKGLGGAGTAARRFGGTIRTASTLYGALSTIAGGQALAEGSHLDPALLAGRSANEVIDAVIEAIQPIDGTQDAEARRNAIRDALSELLDYFPEADLLNLSEDQRFFAIDRYIALEVYTRFRLDVGKSIQDKAPSVSVALARFREVKDYIRESISAAFRRLRTTGQSLTANRIASMVHRAIDDTFQVFEDYVS